MNWKGLALRLATVACVLFRAMIKRERVGVLPAHKAEGTLEVTACEIPEFVDVSSPVCPRPPVETPLALQTALAALEGSTSCSLKTKEGR